MSQFFRDRIKGLKLLHFEAYFGGTAIEETPKQQRNLSHLLQHPPPYPLVYSGTLKHRHIRRGAAVDEGRHLPSSTVAPGLLRQPNYCSAAAKVAMVGKIQLTNVPQFESFYTVPIFYSCFPSFMLKKKHFLNLIYDRRGRGWALLKHCNYFLTVTELGSLSQPAREFTTNYYLKCRPAMMPRSKSEEELCPLCPNAPKLI